MRNSIAEVNEMRRVIDGFDDHVLLLVVGFDGVVVDYDVDPDAVRLSSAMRALLADIPRRRNAELALISGRRVADVRERSGLGEGVFYVGLHGLETAGPGFARRTPDEVHRRRGRIDAIAAAFDSSATSQGIRVENKEAAVAVHTREAGPVEAVWARLHVLNAAADLLNADELRVYRGNHVFELVPNVRAPRARAINAVRRFLERRERKPVLTVYVAEDVRDDDAFGAIKGPAVTVAVGGRAPQAHFHLASTADVRELLAGLVERDLGAGVGCR
jgi:trehalose 6-phosphate phosphatase